FPRLSALRGASSPRSSPTQPSDVGGPSAERGAGGSCSRVDARAVSPAVRDRGRGAAQRACSGPLARPATISAPRLVGSAAALRKAHPYEEPAFDVYALL